MGAQNKNRRALGGASGGKQKATSLDSTRAQCWGFALDMSNPGAVAQIRALLGSLDQRALDLAAAAAGSRVGVMAVDLRGIRRSRVAMVPTPELLPLAIDAALDFFDAGGEPYTSAWVVAPELEPFVRPILAEIQPTVGGVQ